MGICKSKETVIQSNNVLNSEIHRSLVVSTLPISNDFQIYANNTMTNTEKLFIDDGKYSNVRVIDIYDGDTITIALKLFESSNNIVIKKFGVRLMGIDTPEMKSKNADIKKAAFKARDRLYNLITGLNEKELKRKEICDKLSTNTFLVTIKIYGADLYGRILADIYPYDQINVKSFSQVLLDEKLAYAYDGKTKLAENEILEAVE